MRTRPGTVLPSVAHDRGAEDLTLLARGSAALFPTCRPLGVFVDAHGRAIAHVHWLFTTCFSIRLSFLPAIACTILWESVSPRPNFLLVPYYRSHQISVDIRRIPLYLSLWLCASHPSSIGLRSLDKYSSCRRGAKLGLWTPTCMLPHRTHVWYVKATIASASVFSNICNRPVHNGYQHNGKPNDASPLRRPVFGYPQVYRRLSQVRRAGRSGKGVPEAGR